MGGADVEGVVDVEAFIVVEVNNGPLNRCTVQDSYRLMWCEDRTVIPPVQLPYSHSTTLV